MEQRRFPRVRAQWEARYELSVNSPSKMQLAWSQDIGEGGVRLRVSEPLAIGQEIRFALRQRSEEAWWPEMYGTVTWRERAVRSEGENYLAGISFSSRDEIVKNRIRQWLATNKTERAEDVLHALEVEPRDLLIGSAYDGTTITYRLLRAFGWGPLNNLGYFQFPSPFSALNLFSDLFLFKMLFLLPEAQVRLVKRSADLLVIQRGDGVLDVACGRGKGSFLIASTHPESRVTAVDLLPENVQVASTLYSSTRNLNFFVGNALDLHFHDGAFSKVLCLEAAFHFPDRRQFLREAYRVLQRYGRLVVVDFMWKTNEDRDILGDEQTQLVKNTWKWDDFFSIDDYVEAAKEIGFTVQACHNWSRRVTGPLEFVFKALAHIGRNQLGRFLLLRMNPLLSGITDQEWREFYASAFAHDYVRRHVEYVALVLVKG